MKAGQINKYVVTNAWGVVQVCHYLTLDSLWVKTSILSYLVKFFWVWVKIENTFLDFPTFKEKFSCNNAFNNKCTLKLPTSYLDNLSFWCSKIKIMNGTIFLLVGMVKDKFANFWIYSLLSPFESKDYAYTLSISGENGRAKFSHYNGQAHYMFSRIFLIRIYNFFLPNPYTIMQYLFWFSQIAQNWEGIALFEP